MAAGTLLARDVLKSAQRILNDQSNLTWTMDEMVSWLNAAQRSVVLLRPDASSDIKQITLGEGALQTLPDGSIRLLDVRCNVGGRACTYVEKSALDSYDPSWRTATPDSTVVHWLYDDRVPLRFEVYPPQPASGQGTIEISRSTCPTDCTLVNVNGESVDSVIGIPDIFEEALVDYCVYRCYSKDAEYTVRGGKAEMTYQSFLQRLGFQLTTDRRFSPRTNAPPLASQMQPAEGAF